MKRRLTAGLASVGLLLLTACGSGSASHGATLLQAKDVAMARPVPGFDLTPMGDGTRAFGYQLARRLAPTSASGNLVYSPTSLQLGLAMLREGAKGETAATIDRVLHLPADRHRSIVALISELQHAGTGNTVQIGDGLFLDPTLPARASYLATLKKWYGAGVYRTDFPTPAVDDINAYVDKNTHGRIPKLLDELPRDAVMALVNTVYLDAKWQLPFDTSATRDAGFTDGTGRQVQVKTMSRLGNIDYAAGPGWQAVRLPYQGDELSMWVLLPSGTTAPVDLLSSTVLTRAGKDFRPRNLELSLPRWDFGDMLELNPVLASLGLSDLFSAGADFSGVSLAALHLEQVVQQANITVGEKGTVAAAATALITAGGMPTARLDVDHPFAFVIMDNASGVPLFEGIVSDPSRTGTG